MAMSLFVLNLFRCSPGGKGWQSTLASHSGVGARSATPSQHGLHLSLLLLLVGCFWSASCLPFASAACCPCWLASTLLLLLLLLLPLLGLAGSYLDAAELPTGQKYSEGGGVVLRCRNSLQQGIERQKVRVRKGTV